MSRTTANTNGHADEQPSPQSASSSEPSPQRSPTSLNGHARSLTAFAGDIAAMGAAAGVEIKAVEHSQVAREEAFQQFKQKITAGIDPRLAALIPEMMRLKLTRNQREELLYSLLLNVISTQHEQTQKQVDEKEFREVSAHDAFYVALKKDLSDFLQECQGAHHGHMLKTRLAKAVQLGGNLGGGAVPFLTVATELAALGINYRRTRQVRNNATFLIKIDDVEKFAELFTRRLINDYYYWQISQLTVAGAKDFADWILTRIDEAITDGIIKDRNPNEGNLFHLYLQDFLDVIVLPPCKKKLGDNVAMNKTVETIHGLKWEAEGLVRRLGLLTPDETIHVGEAEQGYFCDPFVYGFRRVTDEQLQDLEKRYALKELTKMSQLDDAQNAVLAKIKWGEIPRQLPAPVADQQKAPLLALPAPQLQPVVAAKAQKKRPPLAKNRNATFSRLYKTSTASSRGKVLTAETPPELFRSAEVSGKEGFLESTVSFKKKGDTVRSSASQPAFVPPGKSFTVRSSR